MRVLLDTHALVWALAEPDRLSPRARAVLVDPGTVAFVSLVSAWELSILEGLDRVRLKVPLSRVFTEGLASLRINLLPIRLSHVASVALLPPHHRDPFDRMLVAAAIAEKLSVVSGDSVFRRYGVTVVW